MQIPEDDAGMPLGADVGFESGAVDARDPRRPGDRVEAQMQRAAGKRDAVGVRTKPFGVDILREGRGKTFDRTFVAAEHRLQIVSAGLNLRCQTGLEPLLGGVSSMV